MLASMAKLVRWIEYFLMNKTQQMVIDGIHSKPANITGVIPQGTANNPLLFLIYIKNFTNDHKTEQINRVC